MVKYFVKIQEEPLKLKKNKQKTNKKIKDSS